MQFTPHQKAGRVIRLMAWLSVLISVGILVAVGVPLMSRGDDPGFMVFMVAFFAFSCAFAFIAAYGLLHGRTWGRWVGTAYGVLSLFGFPIGTLIGAYVLWQLAKGWNVSATTPIS